MKRLSGTSSRSFLRLLTITGAWVGCCVFLIQATMDVASAEQIPQQVRIATTTMTNIPHGNVSQGPIVQFHETVTVDSLNFLLTGSTCGTDVYSVQLATSAQPHIYQEVQKEIDGSFRIPGGQFKNLGMRLFQNSYYPSAACTIEIYANGYRQPSTTPSDHQFPAGKFLGTFIFKGGYQENIEIPTRNVTQKLKGFYAAVPDYCSDVKFLSAGTMSEGIFDEADFTPQVRRPFNFTVNDSYGLRVPTIRLTLYAKEQRSCPIAVYGFFGE